MTHAGVTISQLYLSLHPQDDDLPQWRLNKANWKEF